MSEKNYVVNIKNSHGTIVTFRGDTAPDLQTNIANFVAFDLAADIAAVEGVLLGTAPAPVQANPVAVVQNAFPGAQVVATAPAVQQPVQDTSSAAPSAPVCKHGGMTYKSGTGKNGKTWQAYMCAAGQNAPDKCDPQWIR